MRYAELVLSIVAVTAFAVPSFGDTNTDAKLSALRRACAASVFTPQECAQREAILLHAGGANAQVNSTPNGPGNGDQPGVFQDPQGRFSAPVPPGWNANSNNGNATFSSGSSWIMLIPSSDTQPDQAATNIVNQFRQQYRSLDEAQSGRPIINGNNAVFATFRAINGKGESVALTVAGIQAPGGHVLVYLSSAPLSEINQISPTLQNVLKGIQFPSQ